jgi:predicted transport protein
MEVKKQKIDLWLKLNPKEFDELPEIARDVTNIGHYGTGDLHIAVTSQEDIEIAKEYITMAYRKVGG